MSTPILFGHRLQQHLAPILDSAGFILVEKIEDPREYLRYERTNPGVDKPDLITFHGLEAGRENAIFASAATAIGEEYWLKTLKELLPKHPSLPIHEDDRWTFSDDQQLDTCLEEIADLVQYRLMPWFDEPVMNPAGMDMEPKVKLSPTELKASLVEQIRLAELDLARARKEGQTEDIESWEWSIQEYQNKLAEIDSNGQET